MTKKAHCERCLKELNMKDDYNPRVRAAICDPKKRPECSIIISLFNQLWSDEAINDRDAKAKQKRLPKP